MSPTFRQEAKAVLDRLGSAVVFVEVESPCGTLNIGSAFHIGANYFATAKHVIDGKRIKSMGRFDTTTKTHAQDGRATLKTTTHPEWKTEVEAPRHHHRNDSVDVALIKVEKFYGPVIQLSLSTSNLTEGEFLMEEVLVLGYPPISTTARPHLVVFRGEVSAVVENYADHQRRFVISGMARGGFSGGPALLLKYPTVSLGVIAHSLVQDSKATELGFISVVTAEAIFEIAEYHNLRIPEIDKSLSGFIIQ